MLELPVSNRRPSRKR